MIGNICYSVEEWDSICSRGRWHEMRRQLSEIIEVSLPPPHRPDRFIDFAQFDTEKMIPAALRALSFITCGISSLSSIATGLLQTSLPPSLSSADYSRVISRLLFGSSSPLLSLTSWQETWTSDLILSHVLLQKVSHHKLLYSICQLLCSYLWSLLLYDSPSLSSATETTGEDLKISEFSYQLLLCLFQQNHFAKVPHLPSLLSSFPLPTYLSTDSGAVSEVSPGHQSIAL
jgi:hypothetical protein